MATIVACPTVLPDQFYSHPGISHVRIFWRKPKLEKPVSTGLEWFFVGLWKDVINSYLVIKKARPSIVHVNGAVLLPAVIAAFLFQVPIVWHFNDTTVPGLFAKTMRVVASSCKAQTIAASRAVVKYYSLSDNTPVIYPPAPTIDVKGLCDQELITRIGVMANLSPGKGLEYVIEAFSIVVKKRPNLSLEIAGRILTNKRWYYELLLGLVETLGFTDEVIFAGYVKDVQSWFQTLGLFVFSSESEAAPVAVIESMASGVPVVAADIPATREILGDCGLLTPLKNVPALARAIERMIDDPQLRRIFRRRGLERARLVFSPTTIGERYLEIYSEVLNERISSI